MVVVQLIIQPKTERIFVDRISGDELVDVEMGIRWSARESYCIGAVERVPYRKNRSNCTRLCIVIWNRFNEVDAVSQAIAFVAAKEEEFVPNNGTANGSAKLVHAKGRLLDTVEEVPC